MIEAHLSTVASAVREVKAAVQEVHSGIEDLKTAIKTFNSSSDNYSRKLVRLTRWLIALTIVLGVLAVPPFLREFKEIWSWFHSAQQSSDSVKFKAPESKAPAH